MAPAANTLAVSLGEEKGKLSNNQTTRKNQQLHQELRKTKLCSYHQRGMCAYATNCNFAHSAEELQPALDLRKTRICRSFENGRCRDEDCRFAHGYQELVTQSKSQQSDLDVDEGSNLPHARAFSTDFLPLDAGKCLSESGSTTLVDGEFAGDIGSPSDCSPVWSPRRGPIRRIASDMSESPLRIRDPWTTDAFTDHDFAQAVKEELESVSLGLNTRKSECLASVPRQSSSSPLLKEGASSRIGSPPGFFCDPHSKMLRTTATTPMFSTSNITPNIVTQGGISVTGDGPIMCPPPGLASSLTATTVAAPAGRVTACSIDKQAGARAMQHRISTMARCSPMVNMAANALSTSPEETNFAGRMVSHHGLQHEQAFAPWQQSEWAPSGFASHVSPRQVPPSDVPLGLGIRAPPGLGPPSYADIAPGLACYPRMEVFQV